MANLSEKVDFLTELALSLHTYGVPAHRIESYTLKMGKRLSLEEIHILSLPTSIQIYVRDKRARTSRMVRARPGGIELKKLKQIDRICDSLVDGDIRLSEGMKQIRTLHDSPPLYKNWMFILSFGVIALAINLLIGTTQTSLFLAPVIGLLTGAIYFSCKSHDAVSAVAEVFAALFASLAAFAAAGQVSNILPSSIILGSIIVLVPGLTITTAIMELATDNLVSGTARFMGAVTVLLKLFLGVFVGKNIALMIGAAPAPYTQLQLPIYIQLITLVFLAMAFIVIFQMEIRDYFWVLAIAVISFASNNLLQTFADPNVAVFGSAFVVSISCHIYARIANSPASNLLVPGIILLVPGSLGFHSLLKMGEQQTLLGIDLGFKMVFFSMLIVGGLLLGQFVLPSKRTL